MLYAVIDSTCTCSCTRAYLVPFTLILVFVLFCDNLQREPYEMMPPHPL